MDQLDYEMTLHDHCLYLALKAGLTEQEAFKEAAFATEVFSQHYSGNQNQDLTTLQYVIEEFQKYLKDH